MVPEERQYGQFRLFGRSWPVAHSPTPLLSLIVILAPVAVLAFLGPRQWFLNTPVLWLGALVLTKILRGSMGRAPSLVRKLLKITISTLFALGLVILLTWDPIREWARRANPAVNAIWLFAVSLCVVVWQVSVVWILIARRKARQSPIASTPIAAPVAVAPQSPIKTIPKEHFNDVGGMEFAKERIREVIEAQLQPEKHRKYRVLRNGILLYGPRGTGKTLLGRAAAGEFRLNFEYVSAPSLYRRWIGATGENIRATFAQAAQRRPVLLFIDEIDSLGAGRGVGGSNDPGGAGREFDNITMQLFTAIDEYRAVDGFIIMAATNRVEAVDEAVIREGRFDVKIRVDLPDERTRLAIFEKQLAKRPWKPFALEDFARKTLGASGAKIEALVDRAAEFALAENRKIEGRDLLQALEASGGKDRPLSRYVSWDDVVIEESVLEDLRSLVRLINDPAKTENMGMSVPTGLLLIGPPGTGKTLIAELIASQTNRSFYPLTAADVLGGNTGDSVKRVKSIFARAREHSPSLIFLDEIDGLLPATNRFLSQHDVQLVEQFLTEIGNLLPEHNVFLVGTTNHLENVDSRVLRGGRFSEKIFIRLPGPKNREILLRRYLRASRLDPGLSIDWLAAQLDGRAPADLEAICITAKRMAFNRNGDADEVPPLTWSDFEKAIQRVQGAA